jgi:hypothetical protein
VDDLADAMQVVQADQHLLGHTPDQWDRDSLGVVPLHDLEQIHAEDLEHHHKVLPIRTVMEERIEQLDCVAVFDGVVLVVFVIPLVVSHSLNPVGIESVSFYDVQDLYFVVRSFYVVHGTLLHLERHIIVVLRVTSEPDGREMAPTKLLHDDVPVNQPLTDVHGMVSTNFVVRDTFVLAGITICV